MYHPRTPSKTLTIVILLIFLLSTSESFDIDEIAKQTSVTHRLLNWAKTLFSPDIDFRTRVNNDQPPTTDCGTTVDKVKEAVGKGKASVEEAVAKGKASVEESAKSAADVTKEKIKDTFTSHNEL